MGLRVALAAIGLIVAAAGPLQAGDLPISAFFGTFKGGGVAENEDSVYFAVTARDFDVVVRRADNGFSVEWASVIRRGGTPEMPRARRKSTTRHFVATGRPGVFRSVKSGDPIRGNELAWARIREKSLIVYLMVINKAGAYQLQRYERKLSGTGMELTFTRLKDGDKVRTVKGRLVKTGK